MLEGVEMDEGDVLGEGKEGGLPGGLLRICVSGKMGRVCASALFETVTPTGPTRMTIRHRACATRVSLHHCPNGPSNPPNLPWILHQRANTTPLN